MTSPYDPARELVDRITEDFRRALTSDSSTKAAVSAGRVTRAIAQALTEAEARGRSRGLEEAAKVADREELRALRIAAEDHDPSGRILAEVDAEACKRVAADIRALKRKGAGS